MHPTREISSVLSSSLAGNRIVLGVTGSIAAVECVKLARALIRHGATVHAVMTPEATRIIGPDALWFATANPVITRLTGAVEHVEMCGDVEGHADLLLIAPCTANTLGKIVAAIDDTPVTTFATTAIGTGIPVIMVPAMHDTMYAHPVVRSNIEKARTMGLIVIDPVISEKKAKMAGTDTIVEHVIRTLSGSPLGGRKVLVVTGATMEPLDEMRVLTNRASGRTGTHLAVEAHRRGAEVLVLAGQNVFGIPEHLKCLRFGSVMDLWEAIETSIADWGPPDIALFPAGISDYIPERAQGKIPSGKDDLTVEMHPAFKVVQRFRRKFKDCVMVGFKAESGVETDELILRAYRRMEEVGMDMVVANELSNVTAEGNRVMIVTPDREVLEAEGSKSEIARIIMDKCLERLQEG